MQANISSDLSQATAAGQVADNTPISLALNLPLPYVSLYGTRESARTAVNPDGDWTIGPGAPLWTAFMALSLTPSTPPNIASITPNSATAGDYSTTFDIVGTGFDSTSVVNFGSDTLTPNFINAAGTDINVTIPYTDLITAGFVQVSVTDTDTGVTSTPMPFTLGASPAPTLCMVVPSVVAAGSANVPILARGYDFTASSQLSLTTAPLASTNFDSADLLDTTAPAVPASPVTGSIYVTTGGGGSSSSVAFTVLDSVINNLSPASAQAGTGTYTLTVNGSGFTGNSVVYWNGAPLATTLVLSTQLTATVPASLIASPGTATIYVYDTGNGLKSNFVHYAVDNFSSLYSFAGSPGDGENPFGQLLQDANTNLWGTTYDGGSAGYGGIYKSTTSGAETWEYSFQGPPSGGADGADPHGGLVLASATTGLYYGTTEKGGQSGYGCIYSYNPNTNSESVVYSFQNSPDGDDPMDGLVQGPGGLLYGTTCFGGIFGDGTVYSFNPATHVETVLYSFAGPDGEEPSCLLNVDSSGSYLYGTTEFGGAYLGLGLYSGTAFKLQISTGVLTTLHNFGDCDGGAPLGGVILAPNGNLYGSTLLGGGNGYLSTSVAIKPQFTLLEFGGTVYQLNPKTTAFETIHNFSDIDSDGSAPVAEPTLGKDGNLYGTAAEGPIPATGTEYGSIYQILLPPPASPPSPSPIGVYTTLHGFSGTDGDLPEGKLFLDPSACGSFYGTTWEGGTAFTSSNVADGTLYHLSVPLPPLAAPTGLTAVVGGACAAQDIVLTWTASAGATTYTIYRATASGAEGPPPIASGVTITNYTDTSITDGTTYYYTVVAVGPCSTSTFSNEASATPQGSNPTVATHATATKALASIVVSPGPTLTLTVPTTQQFTATGLNSGGVPLVPQPTFTWSLVGANGDTISSTGLYTSGDKGCRNVKVDVAANASYALSVLGAYCGTGGESALTYTWAETSGPGTVSFSANGTNAAKNTTATFSAPGTYILTVTITSPGGGTTTSTVTVHVTAPDPITASTLVTLLTPAPTILTPATATPITGNPTAYALSVAVVNTGTTPLPTYTWTETGGPSGVTFTPNGTNTSNNTTATFPQSGTYTLTVTIATCGGTVTSSVTVTITLDAIAFAWGLNDVGQLGNLPITVLDSDVPLTIAVGQGPTTLTLPQEESLTDITTIAAGTTHTLALGADASGTIMPWSWGANIADELGNPAAPTFTNYPVPVVGLPAGVTALASGEFHSLAIANGAVWGWGSNIFGEIGNACAIGGWTVTPAQITSFPTGFAGPAKAIAAGLYHSLALDSAGNVWAFGVNNAGQGGGPGPTQVTGFPGPVTAIADSNGGLFGLAISNGEVWEWGDVNNTATPTPVQVTGFTHPVVAISAGQDFAVALDSTGQVWTWGLDNQGQLCNGTTTAVAPNFYITTGPPGIVAGQTAVKVVAGAQHLLALKASGAVWSCGDNTTGELGHQGLAFTYSASPVTVTGLDQATSIAAGEYFSVAIVRIP